MALIRDIHPDMAAALLKPFYPVVFVYIDWPGAAVRAHTNLGAILWGGNTWTGVGNIGGIDVPDEGGLVPSDASVWILGSTEVLLAEMAVSAATLRNKHAEIFIGVTTTPGGNVLIGEPTSLFAGYLDSRSTPTQNGDGGIQERLQLVLGSGPSARASAEIQHSHEDQQSQYPTDTLFRHLAFADSRRANPAVW